MADRTHIEWTDATWQVVTGCDVLSPGCTNCYAMRLAGTRLKHHPTRAGLTKMTKAGPVWNGEVRFNEALLDQPLRWRRPRRIFVAAHGDLFYEKVADKWIDRVFAVMALAPQHTFQVLTKRSARMREYCASRFGGEYNEHISERMLELDCACTEDEMQIAADWSDMGKPLPNVWLGVSVEDQTRADERIPLLLDTPAAVRWISAEPLLGPVDFEGMWIDFPDPGMHVNMLERLDWVVAGGESAQNKPGRPMHPDWVRSLRDQCRAVGVAFNFKQWGDVQPGSDLHYDKHTFCMDREGRTVPAPARAGDFPKGSSSADGWEWMRRVGARRAGRTLDGRTWDEFPESPSPSTGDGRVRNIDA